MVVFIAGCAVEEFEEFANWCLDNLTDWKTLSIIGSWPGCYTIPGWSPNQFKDYVSNFQEVTLQPGMLTRGYFDIPDPQEGMMFKLRWGADRKSVV